VVPPIHSGINVDLVFRNTIDEENGYFGAQEQGDVVEIMYDS